MTRKKYPRTPHLPWSPGATDDDKMLSSVAHFEGRQVVVTEKMDGENTTIYGDCYTHARSIDSAHHESRAWVKALAAAKGRDIPDGWRLCGEGMYARHSIGYTGLPSYFLLFGIFDENNNALSWSQVEEWAALIEIPTVPVLYKGLWDEEAVKACLPPTSTYGSTPEGYVVRLAEGFPFASFGKSIAKYVRPNHVTTDTHWMQQAIVPNGLDGSQGGS